MRHDSLAHVFEGWDGYQTSLIHAVQPLNEAQLEWRPAQSRRSVAELVRHISLGRITWLARIPAPGIDEAACIVPGWFTDGDGSRHAVEGSAPAKDVATLVDWLNISWQPIRRVLDEWTVSDLATTYRHRFRGVDYEVSRQWTLWRILSHDCHHGGQIAMMLAIQGVGAFELGALGGHIIEPQRAAP
jgi:uncharacterized damage-inducible protein DinB